MHDVTGTFIYIARYCLAIICVYSYTLAIASSINIKTLYIMNHNSYAANWFITGMAPNIEKKIYVVINFSYAASTTPAAGGRLLQLQLRHSIHFISI